MNFYENIDFQQIRNVLSIAVVFFAVKAVFNTVASPGERPNIRKVYLLAAVSVLCISALATHSTDRNIIALQLLFPLAAYLGWLVYLLKQRKETAVQQLHCAVGALLLLSNVASLVANAVVLALILITRVGFSYATPRTDGSAF